MKSISAIHPAIKENTENVLVKCARQRLIIGKPISQYALYSAMFCPLYSNISKEQHEKHLCNPSSHYGKYGEYTLEPVLQRLTGENLHYATANVGGEAHLDVSARGVLGLSIPEKLFDVRVFNPSASSYCCCFSVQTI